MPAAYWGVDDVRIYRHQRDAYLLYSIKIEKCIHDENEAKKTFVAQHQTDINANGWPVKVIANRPMNSQAKICSFATSPIFRPKINCTINNKYRQ